MNNVTCTPTGDSVATDSTCDRVSTHTAATLRRQLLPAVQDAKKLLIAFPRFRGRSGSKSALKQAAWQPVGRSVGACPRGLWEVFPLPPVLHSAGVSLFCPMLPRNAATPSFLVARLNIEKHFHMSCSVAAAQPSRSYQPVTD